MDSVEVPVALALPEPGDDAMSQDATSTGNINFITAHEIGHLLRGGGHDDSNTKNLMASGNISEGGTIVPKSEWRLVHNIE